MKTFDVSQDYNRENFESFLYDFLPDDYEQENDEVYFDFKNIEEGSKLGSCDSLDLDIFEFCTKSNRDPRVTLTKEVVSCMKKYGYKPNALVAFYSKESHSWRLSLITTDYSIENGKLKTEHSNPRRFSFKLGKDCKRHTPETMLSKKVSTFEELRKCFDIEVVTKEFYNNLFAWYTWACEKVTFPTGDTTQDSKGKYNVHQTKENNELNLIRLITRLMFVWFIKQKDLIPSWIFDETELNTVLSEFKPESKKDGNYYNAILQNLFFATLNKKIEERAFADDKKVLYNKQFGVKNFYRDNSKKSFFQEPNEKIIERFKSVPFLNGGLFECLDRLVDDKDNKKNIAVFTDGFSRESTWMAFIPNMLFWQKDDGEHEGLIHLLNRYNFTVEENSPTDVQVALDPELLGKVFENLLGTYNPETSETARKDSGSFYTPRQIVSFMIDESIKDYLSKTIKSISETQLALLFDDDKESYDDTNKTEVVEALKKIKILDPACGSGAFPMGALQRIVHLIQKCGGVPSDKKSLYELKLELIEKCLYGVDIQPIAVQICKLRFFISLICEQEKTDSIKDNYGFNPLPNLETKFVAANSLIGLERKAQNDLFSDPDGKIEEKKIEIQNKRHEHFNAPTAEAKAECRKQDRALREELAKLLEQNKMFAPKDAKQLASWNPYDQNAVSPFFDSEWMFNISNGFDVVIGNPPYIQLQKDGGKLANLYEGQNFKSYAKTGDIYCLFYEKGCNLLNDTGTLCFITSNKWMRAGYGEKLRDYFAKNVNPKLLVDFAGVKVFESATVDTNILLFEKGKNAGNTQSCTTNTLTKDGLSNLSDFVRQNSCECSFATSDSWVILSPIEQSIKSKIEAVGVPLKDWDISINYGIKTGFNDAFIISGAKRDEILANCKTDDERERTAELIRPILRGRDIKRYSYEYADLYLIATFPSKHYDIDDYPAVKDYLLSFGMERLEQTGKKYKGFSARKKTNNKWFETQDSISYWDEFNKPKIVYCEIGSEMDACVIKSGIFINNKLYMVTGEYLEYLLILFNSKLFNKIILRSANITGGKGVDFMNKIRCIIPEKSQIAESIELIKSNASDSAKDDFINTIYGLSEEECLYLANL